MPLDLIAEFAAYIPRDRVEQLLRPAYPLRTLGVALIADISGFTPLTEALTRNLSADQGAEELTRALNGVFTPLIAEIDAFGGSVMKLAGDALIVWFPQPAGTRPTGVIRRALTAATRMQRAMARYGRVPTPIGPVTLSMKIGMAYGPVRRFVLGLPEYGYEDVLGGHTLDRMAEAEHHAEPGDIVVDRAMLPLATRVAVFATEREGHGVLARLQRAALPRPWPAPQAAPAGDATLAARLATYVPAAIAATLRSGQAQVAELKPVVSMFVQFYGVDYDSGDDVAAQLQTYFVAAQQLAITYGGRVNRLITGDKGSLLHVIFGAPRAVEEQEARAVRCALDLQRVCGGLPFITMQRIGVAAGRVFAGPVGAPARHDYTTMGDSINLSARLMQNAAAGQVLIDAGVAARLGDTFELADLGSIRVKGKANPIAVFAAVAVHTGRARAAARPPPLLVGRDAEQTLLRGAAGRPGVVMLAGEVGIGKTLLLDALRAEVRAAGIPRWADGICLAFGATLSGYLFVDLLRDLLDLPLDGGPAATAAALRARCADLFGVERLEATAPYLARFLGLPLDDAASERVAGLSGESLRWRLFELIPDLIRRVAARGPLVLALDDLQWADTTSLELLTTLQPLIGTSALTLVLAMRPEEQSPAWTIGQRMAASGHGHVLRLGPITPQASETLVRRLAPDLPPRLATYLVDRAGGNPLFLVELVRTLRARGLPLDDHEPTGLGLPDTVQGLLVAQIDRLAVEARHTLQLAAVIGRRFLHRVLAALDTAGRMLDARLDELLADAFIQPDERDRGERAYLFRHALIQESAYATLLYERRRAYHTQVAAALERLFPAELVEQAATLAYHYEQAGEPERAISYQLHAGDSARLLGANAEAESLYRRALALLGHHAAGDDERRARIFLRLAAARSASNDHTGAQEWYDQAFGLLEQQGPRAPAPGGQPVVRLGVGLGPSTLDPGLIEGVGDEEIVGDLFEGLVELDAELNVRPALAHRWTVVDDGRRYRFELRPGLRWSDGAPLSAHDLVFAWRRNLHPETGSSVADLLHVVAGARRYHAGETLDPATLGVRALDDRHLEVELEAPFDSLLYLLADPICFPQPAHAYQAAGAGCFEPERLVCNGPFVLAGWRSGEAIRLRRNPSYHGVLAGNLAGAELRFLEPSYAHYQAGAIDLCRIEDRSDLPQQHPAESFVRQFLSTYFLAFDCRRPPFDAAVARRVLALAVDRSGLAHAVWAGVQRPADGGVVPPGMPGHSPELALPYMPDEARAMLAARDRLPPLTLAALPGSGAAPRYLADTWSAQLGLQVQLAEHVPYQQIFEGLADGRYQLALLGCDAAYPDPHAILRDFASGGLLSFGWHNPVFDALVAHATAPGDQRARMERYHRADRLLVAEDVAIVPLYYYRAFGLIRPGLRIAGADRVVRGGMLRLKHISTRA